MSSSIKVRLPVYKLDKNGCIVKTTDDNPLYSPSEQLYLDTKDKKIYVKDTERNEFIEVEGLKYTRYRSEAINGDYSIYYSHHHEDSRYSEGSKVLSSPTLLVLSSPTLLVLSSPTLLVLSSPTLLVPITRIIKDQHLCVYNPNSESLFSVYKDSKTSKTVASDSVKPVSWNGPFATITLNLFKLDENDDFVKVESIFGSSPEIRFTPSQQLYFDTDDQKIYTRDLKTKEFCVVEGLKYQKDEDLNETINGYSFNHYLVSNLIRPMEHITRIVKDQHLYTFNPRSSTFSLYQDKKKRKSPAPKDPVSKKRVNHQQNRINMFIITNHHLQILLIYLGYINH